jgi:hypothetical protein
VAAPQQLVKPFSRLTRLLIEMSIVRSGLSNCRSHPHASTHRPPNVSTTFLVPAAADKFGCRHYAKFSTHHLPIVAAVRADFIIRYMTLEGLSRRAIFTYSFSNLGVFF